MIFVVRVLLSALIISFVAWLSGRFPITAGFIAALPTTTMLVLPMSYLQHGNAGNTMLLAKSIFAAIPVTMAFFVPFLLSGRLGLSFWQAYGLGVLMLCLGFLAHRAVVGLL
jgi:hypothetical protein